MGSRGWIGAALAGLVLLLAAFVASTSPGLEWSQDASESIEEAQQSAQERLEQRQRDRIDDPDQDLGLPQPPPWMYLGLLPFAAALFLILVRRLAVARRNAVGRVPDVHESPLLERAAAPPTPEELATELEARLAELEQGTPRNAIVAIWVELERLADATGFQRRPSDTSSDFTRRALATYDLEEAPLRRLADLYREARFSEHELVERHRDEARACLLILRDELLAGSR